MNTKLMSSQIDQLQSEKQLLQHQLTKIHTDLEVSKISLNDQSRLEAQSESLKQEILSLKKALEEKENEMNAMVEKFRQMENETIDTRE